LAYITAIMSLLPVFAELIRGFIKTPAEKQQEFVRRAQAAVKFGNDTGGDTSKEEGIINGR